MPRQVTQRNKQVSDKHYTSQRLLVRFGDLLPQAPQWLIHGLIEKEQIAVVFGDPATGKTFFGLDIAASVATGTKWHGHRTERQQVVYVAGEGYDGLIRRLKAWELFHGASLSDASLLISTMPILLGNPQQTASLIEEIDSKCTQPGLVIVDTLARNFGAGDENSTADMNKFITTLDQIRIRYGCTVLVIHHSGHGDKRRARGAIALRGAADAEYRIERDNDGVIGLHPMKMKDADPPPEMSFELAAIALDFTDQDGEVVTSAALQPLYNKKRPAKRSGAKTGLGRRQKQALSILDQLAIENGETCDTSGGESDVPWVSVDAWREAMSKNRIPKASCSEIPRTLEKAGEIVIRDGSVSRL